MYTLILSLGCTLAVGLNMTMHATRVCKSANLSTEDKQLLISGYMPGRKFAKSELSLGSKPTVVNCGIPHSSYRHIHTIYAEPYTYYL